MYGFARKHDKNCNRNLKPKRNRNHRKTGRWYLTARAACGGDDSTGAAGRDRDRRLRRRRRILEAAATPEVATQTEEEGEREGNGNDKDEDEDEDEHGEHGETEEEGRKPDGGRRAGASVAGEEGGQGQEKNIYSGSGWGLEVLSLQRDWAHVEWSADFLVPGAVNTNGDAGEEDEAKSKSEAEAEAEAEACSSSAGGEDAFVFRAAAIAEVRGPPARPLGGTERGKGCASCIVLLCLFCLFSRVFKNFLLFLGLAQFFVFPARPVSWMAAPALSFLLSACRRVLEARSA